MDKTFKEILSDIKCGRLTSPVFTEADLANVKLCLPEPVSPPTQDATISVPEKPSCVNDGVESAKKILVDQLKKQPKVIEAGLIRSKIEEALDHYKVILKYHQTRIDFFTSTIASVEPFTAQFVYWDAEYTRLLSIENSYLSSILNGNEASEVIKLAINQVSELSDSIVLNLLTDSNLLASKLTQTVANQLNGNAFYKTYVQSRINRILAESNRLQAKNGATSALAQSLETVQSLGTVSQSKAIIESAINQFSGQLIPEYYNAETVTPLGFVVPGRTLAFGIRLIDLDFIKSTVPSIKNDGTAEQVEKTFLIRKNPLLTRDPFGTTQGTYCLAVTSTTDSNFERNYDLVRGALYNKQPNGYAGFYRKLANPISLLFTPEERGLSIDPSKIDPLIKDIKDAPVSIKEGDFTLYISNQAQYERFYETFNEALPDRIKRERDQVFPQQIEPTLRLLESIATREVADFFRQTTDSAVRLARPVSYKAGTSSIFTQGEFTFSELDSIVSGRLAYYIKAADQIKERIADCEFEIAKLNDVIKQNSMDADLLAKKISAIPCFQEAAKVKATNPDCEAKTLAKLGTDPLFIRTLDGTDASLPDMNNPCYWREFTKSLNKVSLLPFPDLTSLIFRYYPITNIIPTPLGIVMIPTPQKWINLFSLSTPVGTLVTFLTIPAAICGIPLPSVYMFYFSPDGRKYLLLAPNIPLIYPTNSLKYGFEVDDSQASQNPFGINPSDPFKGLLTKGSLSLPVKIGAESSRATRLAGIAASLALGQPIPITTKAGDQIGTVDPLTYSSKYLSMNERIANSADFDPAKDFEKQLKEFRRNLNRQFDRLGEMQITAVSRLKDKTRNDREANVRAAENEPNLKAKREAKKAARKLDPISLNQKISSVLSDFEAYIDKIKLGTIKFPDDPTKLNPKLPGAVTGMQTIIEQATKGALAKDSDSKNLTAKLRKMAAQIDVDNLKSKKNFNLTKKEGVDDFKAAIKEYANTALAYLSGDKSPFDEKIDPNLSESEKKEIARANELRKKRLKQALAFTSLSVVAPKLKLFDPAAPCCSVDSDLSESPISPQVLAIIAVFNGLLDGVLSGLTVDSLKEMFGDSASNVGIGSISSFFDMILTSLPPLILPDKADILAISQAVMVPVLSALHIPQAPNPLGIPFPVQIKIPLDAIIKPVLKAAVAYLLELILRLLSDAGSMLLSGSGSDSTNNIKEIIQSIPCGDSQTAIVSTTTASSFTTITLPGGISIKLPKIPTIALDIVSYFSLLTSTDLVELIRGLVFAALDGVLKPLKDIITPILSLTRSLKDLTFNIIEAANPFVLPLKLAIMAIQLQIPNSVKLRIANFDAINAIKLAYLPVVKATEPVLKEVAYLGSIAACAFGSMPGVQIARVAANPFFNQDDLPPWERLTHKNPLFAIFLDEIAWRGSLVSTGSLIFKTKMPGLYPTSVVVNVISDTGRHLG